PEHPDTLHTILSLAAAYTDADRHREALALHGETLERLKATFGPAHPDTLLCMHGYARANHKAGKLDEAERLLRAALQLQREKAKLPSVDMLAWLSRNLLMQGKHVEAEAVAYEALALVEKEVHKWRRFVVMSLLGGALLGQGKHAGAELLLLQGYEGLKEWEAKTNEP